MAIVVSNLVYRYPNGYEALKGVNLRIEAGEQVAIIGQNGAGKTSLVKHFNGLLKPSEGQVTVNGVDTREKTTAQLARLVGYVFQNPDDQLFNSTIREELRFGPRQLGMPAEEIDKAVERVAQLTGLQDVLDKNPYDVSESARKMIAIGSVLTMDPDIIVMDEPTAGQSYDQILVLESILAYARRRGKTVITIIHDMEFVARNFDRVIVMHEGQVLMDGTPREVFARPDVLAASRLRPPFLSRLSAELGLPLCFTVQELLDALAASKA